MSATTEADVSKLSKLQKFIIGGCVDRGIIFPRDVLVQFFKFGTLESYPARRREMQSFETGEGLQYATAWQEHTVEITGRYEEMSLPERLDKSSMYRHLIWSGAYGFRCDGHRGILKESGSPRMKSAWASTTRAIARLRDRGLIQRVMVYRDSMSVPDLMDETSYERFDAHFFVALGLCLTDKARTVFRDQDPVVISALDTREEDGLLGITLSNDSVVWGPFETVTSRTT